MGRDVDYSQLKAVAAARGASTETPMDLKERATDRGPPTREPARKKIPRGEQKKNKRRAKTMKNDSPQLLQTRTANLNRAGTGANRRREIQICTRSKNPGAYFNAVRLCKYLSKFDADRWVASFAGTPYLARGDAASLTPFLFFAVNHQRWCVLSNPHLPR